MGMFVYHQCQLGSKTHHVELLVCFYAFGYWEIFFPPCFQCP